LCIQAHHRKQETAQKYVGVWMDVRVDMWL